MQKWQALLTQEDSRGIKLFMSHLESGITAYESSDFMTAFQILMPLAKAGNLQAQKIIANMYDLGEGIKVDRTEAIKWFRLAALQGDVIAQNNLATLLLDENAEEAIKWYKRAAEKNFPFSQEVLGDIYSGKLTLPSYIAQKKF